MTKLARVLVIAGSDSSGGAGIQADIKTITALGGYAAAAITALTAQNSQGVSSVFLPPPEFVAEQIAVTLEDIGADALKIGMVANAPIIAAVAQAIRPACAQGIPLVLDPVMVAATGAQLLNDDAVSALKSELLPLATIITPNEHEASILTGNAVSTRKEQEQAALTLAATGAALVTGGEGQGETLFDALAAAGQIQTFSSPKIASRHTHGTGCTLASAIAVSLAQGLELTPAIARAREFVRQSILAAPGFGKGRGPLNHAFDR